MAGIHILTSEFSFDAAHFLKGHDGKCKNLHGHRWRVVVDITGDLLRSGSSKGMVIDFTHVKNALKLFEGRFDHKLLLEEDSYGTLFMNGLDEMGFEYVILPFRTTAENLSKYFYTELNNYFDGGLDVIKVSVYETPNNVATYEEV